MYFYDFLFLTINFQSVSCNLMVQTSSVRLKTTVMGANAAETRVYSDFILVSTSI